MCIFRNLFVFSCLKLFHPIQVTPMAIVGNTSSQNYNFFCFSEVFLQILFKRNQNGCNGSEKFTFKWISNYFV